MIEKVSGYSRNPCSLNRERDAAFAAKLLTLPIGFFFRVDGAFASISWRRECVRGGFAPSANELSWFYKGFRQSARPEAFPKCESSRSVLFPIQRTRVTWATWDVLYLLFSLATAIAGCMSNVTITSLWVRFGLSARESPLASRTNKTHSAWVSSALRDVHIILDTNKRIQNDVTIFSLLI